MLTSLSCLPDITLNDSIFVVIHYLIIYLIYIVLCLSLWRVKIYITGTVLRL